METVKSPDLVSKLETQESRPNSSSLQKTKEPTFQLKSWVGKGLMSQSSSRAGVPSYFWESQTFCSSQAFSWLEQGPPTFRRATCSTQSTQSNVNLNQKDTQNTVWPNVWAFCGPVHWTQKMDPASPLERWSWYGQPRWCRPSCSAACHHRALTQVLIHPQGEPYSNVFLPSPISLPCHSPS